MSRLRSVVCRICKQSGTKLYLKGTRCETEKCLLSKKAKPTRTRGKFRSSRGDSSEYKTQLVERRKVRNFYGVTERQFRRYFSLASQMKGKVGENFLQILERRLDNCLYLTKFLPSRRACRQAISHRHIILNRKRTITIPSYLVKIGDEIEIKKNSPLFSKIKEVVAKKENVSGPSWLEIDRENLRIKVIRFPERNEITIPVDEQHIVNYYSSR
jgi:small subunit ribosomal protein S4